MTLTADQLLTTTRSVRKRLDLTTPVPLELIKECLELAVQAPNSSNAQEWRWLVVTDRAKRAAIGDYYKRSFEAYARSPNSARNRFADDPERAAVQQRVAGSAAYLAAHMGEVPVHVIGCVEMSLPEFGAGSQAGLWGTILPAAWSFMLAARSRGLGTAWTTLHLRYEREIAELLGMPPHVRQGVLLPTAYYTGETFRPAPRRPLPEILHVDRW